MFINFRQGELLYTDGRLENFISGGAGGQFNITFTTAPT